jgi:DNA-binding transcriptional ArsR family regulator
MFERHRTMLAEAEVSPVAALLADRARAAMLWALSDGRTLPACELALRGRVRPSTASSHLGKLVAGGLLTVEKHGRHRQYRLAGPQVVGLLEALATVAPAAPARSFQDGQRAKAVRFARACYDHLAGRVGVELAAVLVQRGRLRLHGKDYQLTRAGERFLGRLGIDLGRARGSRRAFARACLDWSERKHHLAGALGALLLERLLALGWLERTASSRALRLCERGRRGLAQRFGLELPSGLED